MKKGLFRILCILVALAVLAVSFSGCGSQKPGNQESGTLTEKSGSTAAASDSTKAAGDSTKVSDGPDKYPLPKVIEYTQGNWGWDWAIPEQDAVGKEIEKKFSAKINVPQIKVGNYADIVTKMNTWAAAGMQEWPNIMMGSFDAPTKDIINRLGKQGKLLDLMPYLDQFPKVKEAVSILLPFMKTKDGHLYALPSQYSDIRIYPNAYGIWLRKDWIEQLGLSWPKTIPELEQVLTAFKDKIKTVDGKPVVPMAEFGEDFLNKNLIWAFYPNSDVGVFDVTASNNTSYRGVWYWDPNKQEAVNLDMEDTQYLIKAVQWHNKIYHKGLIPKDCFAMKQGQIDELANQGRAGSVFGMDYVVGPYCVSLAAKNPKAIFTMPPTLYEPSVNSGPQKQLSSVTPWTLWPIKADTPKEQVYGFLKYLEWCSTKEGTLLTYYGIEGVHWQYNKNGRIEDTPDCASRLKGDWNLRAHEGIGLYGVINDFGVMEKVQTNLDPTSPSMPEYLKQSIKTRGNVFFEGYAKNPNFYIAPGKEEIKRTVGATDRYKEMLIKAITGDPAQIPDIVKKWHDTEYNMGYEIIKKERTELCKELDLSTIP